MVRERVLNVDSHQLAVQTGDEAARGDGPPVVFLHGILGSVRFWPALVPELATGGQRIRRWYSLGLPGHHPGRLPPRVRPEEEITPERMADLLSKAIRQLVGGEEPVALIGWSTGGCLALQLAARHPRQVLSVLGLAGFSCGRWHGGLGLLQKLARSGPVGRLAFRAALRALTSCDWLFRRAHDRAAVQTSALRANAAWRQALQATRRDAARHDPVAMQALFACIRDWEATEPLQAIRAPVTLLAGRQDPIIRYEHVRQLSRVIPRARLVTFADTGHAFFAERPEAFRACLADWLASLGGAPSSCAVA